MAFTVSTSVPSKTRRGSKAVCCAEQEQGSGRSLTRRDVMRGLVGLAFGLGCSSASAREVASIPASGLIFKDFVHVVEFEDPKVPGVRLYISEFDRPLVEKVQSNFFSDPSQASVTCVKTKPVIVSDQVPTSKEGEEVFNQGRNLVFKSIHVNRVYDKEAGALIYISYVTRMGKGDDKSASRFKSSICAVPIDGEAPSSASR